MKTLSIGICENSDIDRQTLIRYFETVESILGISCKFQIYDSSSSFLCNYHPIFDMVLLNIDLINPNDSEIVAAFRKIDPKVPLVLMSNSNKVFSTGYKYKADNCWQKPVRYTYVFNEIKKLLKCEHLLSEPYLLFSCQRGIHKMYYRKLRYIETGNRQLIFHYDGEQFTHIGTLLDYEKELCPKTFFRCNNSYLVNIAYVEDILPDSHRYKIRLITGEEIPLSRNKKKELIELMRNASLAFLSLLA